VGSDLKVANCKFLYNEDGAIINTSYSEVVNTFFYRNNKRGLWVGWGDALAVIGCTFLANSYGNPGVYAQLYAEKSVNYLKVIGCEFNGQVEGVNYSGGALAVVSGGGYTPVSPVVIGNTFRNHVADVPVVIDAINPIITRNIGYATENSGTATVTGDGVATTFTADVAHGLVKDTATAKITLDRDGTVDKAYLVDTDADGFKETLRIQVTYAAAPASGETVPIYWEAQAV
jgi:hypothetical protein